MKEGALYSGIVWIVVLFLAVGLVGSVTESAVTRLTDSPVLDQHSDWNSEGSEIVFESERTENRDIWVMDADGENQRQLTDDPEKDWAPSWKPGTSIIAFTSKRTEKTEIWSMNSDGLNMNLNQITDDGKGNKWPAWSPDGEQIAYEVGKGEDTIDIWVMMAGGGGKTPIITDPADDRYPKWNPDGDKIVFASNRGGNWDIYVKNSDGSGVAEKLTEEGNNHVPTWHGDKIVFYSDRSGNNDIWIMDDDGSNERQVTTDPASDECPFLSPDATKIAFCSDRSGNKDVYLIDVPSEVPATTSPPTTTPAPTTPPPKKKRIVVLANSIDFELASDFYGFLGNKGMETVHATASDFEQYKEEKFIVILGGPDAPEGVGPIVQEVLSEAEQNAIREKGARKKYVKTNMWTQGQRVTVIAGSDRNETKNSEDENKDSVVTEAEASS